MAPTLDAPDHPRYRLEARDGRRAFAKVAADAEEAEDLRREAEVLRLLARRLPASAGLAPRLLGWSEEEGVLRVEAIEGEDLGRRTRAAGLLDASAAAALGTALALLHREGRGAVRDLPGPASSGPVGVHRPTPADLHGYSAGALEVLVLLQRSAPLCAELDRLCVPPPAETLVHGDVKLENVLVGGPTGMRLVDWEFAGAGEALWDVAFVMASCLGAWLSSVPQVPAVPPDRLMREAGLPLAGVRPGLAALWLAYRGAHVDGGAGLRRCLDLTAVRLVQLAVEVAGDAEDLRAVSAMHLQVAQNMLERPEAASQSLLGLPLRDD
jgi:aminoglycoside phosphotransferase (APT) family kinase protein